MPSRTATQTQVLELLQDLYSGPPGRWTPRLQQNLTDFLDFIQENREATSGILRGFHDEPLLMKTTVYRENTYIFISAEEIAARFYSALFHMKVPAVTNIISPHVADGGVGGEFLAALLDDDNTKLAVLKVFADNGVPMDFLVSSMRYPATLFDVVLEEVESSYCLEFLCKRIGLSPAASPWWAEKYKYTPPIIRYLYDLDEFDSEDRHPRRITAIETMLRCCTTKELTSAYPYYGSAAKISLTPMEALNTAKTIRPEIRRILQGVMFEVNPEAILKTSLGWKLVWKPGVKEGPK
jgi:hypothetical protein